MKIKYKIPSKLYSLDIDSEKLVELCVEGNNFFNQVLEVLDTSINENKALLVYRGERKSCINDELNFNDDLDDLFCKIFHVGTSSKYFIKSNNFKKYLNNINDISNEVFEIIFDKIYKQQKQNDKKNDFKSYFTNIDNKKDFLEKITNLNNISRLRVRDYYFSYLHQEAIDKNQSSFFVSTSKKIKKAEYFAGKKENKIVIFYFLSKPYIDLAIYSKNKQYLKNYCEKNNLQTYKAPYPKQDEISVKGALFPDNILGVTSYINEEEVFIVNPYLFYYYDNHLENFIKEGLPVNQEKFYENLLKVNGKGILLYDSNNKFEEIR